MGVQRLDHRIGMTAGRRDQGARAAGSGLREGDDPREQLDMRTGRAV